MSRPHRGPGFRYIHPGKKLELKKEISLRILAWGYIPARRPSPGLFWQIR